MADIGPAVDSRPNFEPAALDPGAEAATSAVAVVAVAVVAAAALAAGLHIVEEAGAQKTK